MRQEVEASTYKPPHTKRGRTTTNSPPNACSSYVKLYLGRPSKASKSLVLFCIFLIRRKSRTLVQKSVPGDTMIFVVRSDLKSTAICTPSTWSSCTLSRIPTVRVQIVVLVILQSCLRGTSLVQLLQFLK